MISLFSGLGLVFLVTGAGVSLFAARQFVRTRAFVRRSEVASGVVVSLRDDRDPEMTGPIRFPTVRFRTAAGRDVTFESAMGVGGHRWSVGDAVSVRYQRDRPDVAELEGFAALWVPLVVMAVLAAIFVVIGVVLLFADALS